MFLCACPTCLGRQTPGRGVSESEARKISGLGACGEQGLLVPTAWTEGSPGTWPSALHPAPEQCVWNAC